MKQQYILNTIFQGEVVISQLLKLKSESDWEEVSVFYTPTHEWHEFYN